MAKALQSKTKQEIVIPYWSREAFDAVGVKTVTPNDKKKHAIVVDASLKEVLHSAGLKASERPKIMFTVIGDERKVINGSYYISAASKGGRGDEERLGREVIGAFLAVDDVVLIARRGASLFISNLTRFITTPPSLVVQEVAESIFKASHGDRRALREAARAASGPAKKITKTGDVYHRSPTVSADVLSRANGKCEMPDCSVPLFLRSDKTTYLEIHHVIPLSAGGDDSPLNTAALCPSCHRELHFGVAHKQLQQKLKAALPELEASYDDVLADRLTCIA